MREVIEEVLSSVCVGECDRKFSVIELIPLQEKALMRFHRSRTVIVLVIDTRKHLNGFMRNGPQARGTMSTGRTHFGNSQKLFRRKSAKETFIQFIVPLRSSCTAKTKIDELDPRMGLEKEDLLFRSEEHTSELQSQFHLVC